MKQLLTLRSTSPKTVFAILVALVFGLFLAINYNTLIAFDERANAQMIEQEAVNTPKYVDLKQLKCLATNIFFEAGSESSDGKAAVARVVMNRVRHGFASSPCTVVYQAITVTKSTHAENTKVVKVCQFSWVCEGKGSPNRKDPRYVQSERIAYNVLAYDSYRSVVPSTTLFFHNTQVDPSWPYRKVARIGNHIFYEKGKKQKPNKEVVYAKL